MKTLRCITLLVLIWSFSSYANAEAQFGSTAISRALTLEITLNYARDICPFKTSAKSAKAAFEHYSSEAGVDVRNFQEFTDNKDTDDWAIVTAMRAGRTKGISDALTYMGKENFCIGSLWMYGPNGIVYSGILSP